jgi:hypothetical protein
MAMSGLPTLVPVLLVNTSILCPHTHTRARAHAHTRTHGRTHKQTNRHTHRWLLGLLAEVAGEIFGVVP